MLNRVHLKIPIEEQQSPLWARSSMAPLRQGRTSAHTKLQQEQVDLPLHFYLVRRPDIVICI
jgi:hypothetical protein